MRWLPSLIGVPLNEYANNSGNDILRFISQLFPTEFTLNILTLSGLTVAIGRVVDDSIVVLENTYRYIQQGMAPREAAITATREVAIAIFAATLATMCVFLPLGLVGGLISLLPALWADRRLCAGGQLWRVDHPGPGADRPLHQPGQHP